ncbi:MAG TPA: hypothetical protein VNH46_05955, partial [Gemmatimonadales bacterium]|nr:hypothetical protein [Gemmatimonadales bacterium]
SFRLDRFLGMHVDIAENPPNAPHGGAHQNANPGISMVAAIPYFFARPAVDLVVARAMAHRPPDSTVVYKDNRWRRVEFYKKIRAAGLDIRFGLVSAITQVFCMAPLTALSVVVIFQLLLALGLRHPLALGLSLLYAFGTPVFFRAAFLNQNLGIAVFAILAFYLLWDPGDRLRLGVRSRFVLAGLLGGLCFLCDYSGALAMALLGLYGWVRRRDAVSWGRGFRDALWYAAGTLPGVLLLWYYQWASFGNPFKPPQAWMEPITLTEAGYRGVTGPTLELFRLLLLDPRYGLFITTPVALLALLAPWLVRRRRSFLPARETWFCLGFTLIFVVFFSAVQYTRLQYVTGIRYLAAVLPFLFLPMAAVLVRLPRLLAYALASLSILIVWCMAMVRSQGTVLDNIEHVFIAGLQLPWLTVVWKLSAQYAPWLTGPVSPIPFFLLLGLAITLLWTVRRPGQPLADQPEP